MSRFRQPPGLRHLAFFEALATEPPGSLRARAAKAGLLVMRLIDHWTLAGPVMVQPESRSVTSVRASLLALDAADPVRQILVNIVNVMQTCRDVDIEPIVPRLAAYGMLLRRDAVTHALGEDVDATVVRLSLYLPGRVAQNALLAAPRYLKAAPQG